MRELRHLHEVVALDDVELTERRLIHRLIARECRGVRAHGLRAFLRLARLVENQQLVAARKGFRRRDEALAVAQLFDVAHGHFGRIVLREVFEVLREIHASLVAGVDEVAERHTQTPRNRIHRSAHVAALREQADAALAFLHRSRVEHRCEVGVRLRVQVRKAHCVRACNDQVRRRDIGFEFGLQRRAFFTFFGKARGVDDHRTRALGRAALEHREHVGRGNRQHHEIGRFGQRFDVGIAALAEHFFVLRVDRKNLALITELGQMRDRHAADARGVVACADDGDRCGIEQRLKTVCGLVGHAFHVLHGRQHCALKPSLDSSGWRWPDRDRAPSESRCSDARAGACRSARPAPCADLANRASG